jgi:HEAT repeat protein
MELSNLDRAELELLKQRWITIPAERRRSIAHHLVDLSEENFELNFEDVFRELLGDTDDEVRAAAVSGLWESENTVLINPLVKLFAEDSSAKIQVEAAAILGKFILLGEHGKLRPVYTSRIGQALMRSVSNESRRPEVRRRALEAVAPLSLPSVKKAIMAAYTSNTPKFKISAIHAMGKHCDRDFLPLLIKELSSPDAETRYEAVTALGELGEKEAVPYLTNLIGDHDIDVQLATIRALGQIGGIQARDCLKQILNSPNEAIRQAAEAALEELYTYEHPLGLQT